jgi:hypothetical protein
MIIKTKANKEIIIDDEDYPKVKKYSWRVEKDGYAIARTKDFGTTRITIHNIILKKKNPKNHIDHINRDKLDNRKKNLRECTHSQNKMNRPMQSNSTSKIKGVFWVEERKRWLARLFIRPNLRMQKRFKNKKEAIHQRKIWEKEFFREFNYKKNKNQMNKKLKRKRKLAGRKICHGNTTRCQDEHSITTKKTPKGTKPKKKEKKIYKKKTKTKFL